jgi:hypothetical protein
MYRTCVLDCTLVSAHSHALSVQDVCAGTVCTLLRGAFNTPVKRLDQQLCDHTSLADLGAVSVTNGQQPSEVQHSTCNARLLLRNLTGKALPRAS